MRRIFVLFVALFAGSAVAGFQDCGSIKKDDERLACFDLELAKANKPPAKSKGNWIVKETINPVDDSQSVMLILYADEGRSRWGKKVALVLRCDSNQTDAYINWGTYLGQDGFVLTRVDKKEAEAKPWNVSTSGDSAFHQEPMPFIKELIEAKKLLAQTQPYGEGVMTATFDLTGIDEEIAPLRSACAW